MKPLFVISCPIDTFSGYGARSRDVVLSIINKNKRYKNWVVLKKGTHSYKAVMEMIKPITVKTTKNHKKP